MKSHGHFSFFPHQHTHILLHAAALHSSSSPPSTTLCFPAAGSLQSGDWSSIKLRTASFSFLYSHNVSEPRITSACCYFYPPFFYFGASVGEIRPPTNRALQVMFKTFPHGFIFMFALLLMELELKKSWSFG